MGAGAPQPPKGKAPHGGALGSPHLSPEGMTEAGEKPKLFVHGDADWKAQAQKEKERLAKQAEAEKGKGGAPRELPPPSFAGLVGDLGLQTLLALGLVEEEGAAKAPPDLPAARFTIDLLGVLQEKTRGNLTPGEKAHLDELLQSLRLHYARVAR